MGIIKKTNKEQILSGMWRNQKHTLLAGMPNDTATLEITWAILPKNKHRVTM